MATQLRILAIDVDWESLGSLREAFPQCHLTQIAEITADSLERDWNPGAAELLVVNVRDPVAKSLGLVRALRSQQGRAHVTLLVTVASGQVAFVQAALEAGATACLTLPVHAKELASMWNRAREVHQPGRHTRDMNHAQRADPWRDEGGES